MFFRLIKYNLKSFITKIKLVIITIIFTIISLNTHKLIQVIPKVTEFNINTVDNIVYTFGGIYNYIVHSKLEYIMNLLFPYLIFSTMVGSFLEDQIHYKVYTILTRIKSLKIWYSGLVTTICIASILYVILGYVIILIVSLLKLPSPIEYSSHLKALLNIGADYSPTYALIIFFILQVISILNISSIQLIVSISTKSSIKGIVSGLSFYVISAFIGIQNYSYLKFIPGFQVVISRNNIPGINNQGVDVWWSIVYNLILFLLIYILSVYIVKKNYLKF